MSMSFQEVRRRIAETEKLPLLVERMKASPELMRYLTPHLETAPYAEAAAALAGIYRVIGMDKDIISASVSRKLAHRREREEFRELLQEAADASQGDSNDREIEALQDALDMALSLLGIEMPEPREEDDDEV